MKAIATLPDGEKHEVTSDNILNKDDWFGKTWFVYVGCGFGGWGAIVEADCEQDAIDVVADERPYWIEVSEADNAERVESGCDSYAGNASIPVDLDDIRILSRCTVEYIED